MKLLLVAVLLSITPLATRAQKPAPLPPITSVAMEQFECFWDTCPHYVIAINKDGSANYVGLAVAKKRGGVALQLPATAFDRIAREIDKIKFFDLRNAYASKEDGCKEMRTDQSSVSFFVTRGEDTKVVQLYYGCELPGVTDHLAGLASLIDEVTGIRPLLGRGQ